MKVTLVNGATIFPRCLFFVNETENPVTRVQAGLTNGDS